MAPSIAFSCVSRLLSERCMSTGSSLQLAGPNGQSCDALSSTMQNDVRGNNGAISAMTALPSSARVAGNDRARYPLERGICTCCFRRGTPMQQTRVSAASSSNGGAPLLLAGHHGHIRRPEQFESSSNWLRSGELGHKEREVRALRSFFAQKCKRDPSLLSCLWGQRSSGSFAGNSLGMAGWDGLWHEGIGWGAGRNRIGNSSRGGTNVVVAALDPQSEGAVSPRRQSSDAGEGYRMGEGDMKTGMPGGGAGGIKGKAKKKKKKKAATAPAPPKEEPAAPAKQLPLVYDRLNYSDVLELGKEGKIATIIKHPTMSLGGDRGRVFTVVEPERRVFRVVLPSGEDDPDFWKAWKELDLGKKVESVQVKTTQPAHVKKEARKKDGPISWVPVSEGVLYAISILCMWLLYQVVVWQRKKKADYKERKRLEMMESEEREKIKQEEQEKEQEIQEELAKKMEGMDQEKRKEVETVLSNADLSAAMRFMRSGAKIKAAGKSRAPKRYTVGGENVKFSDCAGLGQIRYELEEVVDFFKNREKYLSRGSRIPAGILLSGEPGVGKTLLAKAVAGEANVTFLAISASQFVEVYVGVGAARVRALYTEAKEQAPAVVFIDEIDAVGRKRGMAEGSGGEERDATLNQLLINLDGFEGKGDVITIAATNRVDILDEALVRPGRFDRKIYVPKPGPRQRAEILQVHARGKPLADNLNWQALGEISEGLAGAELAQAMNNAALIMLRKGRDKIREEDISEAITLAGVGVEDPRPRSLKRQRMLAVHQASQLVLAYASPFMRDAIGAINIVPRLGEKVGRMRIDLDPFLFLISGQSARFNLDYICTLLAPRAVDEAWNGAENLSTISMDFMEGARDLAMSMVMCGMSDNENLYGLMLCMYSREEYWEIDKAVDKILDEAYKRTMQIILKNRSLIDAVVDQLVDKSSLERREYLPLFEFYGNFDDIPNRTPKHEAEMDTVTKYKQEEDTEDHKETQKENTGALPS